MSLDYVFENAKRYRYKFFLSYEIIKNNESFKLKYSALASKKKLSPKATVRNRARRRLKNAMRLAIKQNPCILNLDVSWILMANQNSLKANWIELYLEVEKCWNLLKIK